MLYQLKFSLFYHHPWLFYKVSEVVYRIWLPDSAFLISSFTVFFPVSMNFLFISNHFHYILMFVVDFLIGKWNFGQGNNWCSWLVQCPYLVEQLPIWQHYTSKLPKGLASCPGLQYLEKSLWAKFEFLIPVMYRLVGCSIGIGFLENIRGNILEGSDVRLLMVLAQHGY